jgi:hypothetical protein
MEVQVKHGLPPIVADIRNDSVAGGIEPLLPRDLSCREEQLP